MIGNKDAALPGHQLFFETRKLRANFFSGEIIPLRCFGSNRTNKNSDGTTRKYCSALAKFTKLDRILQ